MTRPMPPMPPSIDVGSHARKGGRDAGYHS